MSEPRGAALAALRNKVNKAYSGSVSSSASNRKNSAYRISSGSLALDFGCGVEPGGSGGLPVGRISMFLGEKSSGKTTVALKIIAQAQRLCSHCYRPAADWKAVPAIDASGQPLLTEDGEPVMVAEGRCDCYKKGLWRPKKPEMEKKAEQEAWAARLLELTENSYEPYQVVYLDVEDALDIGWAAQNGVNLDLMEHIVPGYAEQAIDLAAEYVKSGVVDLLIIDSIAAMVPMKELESSAEDWQQGLQARLTNKMVRELVGSAATSRTTHQKFLTQIWINQFREKIGAMVGAGKTTPGGKGQRFATSIEIEFFTSDAEEEVIQQTTALAKDDQMKRITEKRINFTVIKNKTGPDRIKGSFRMAVVDRDLIKAGDIMEQEYLLKLAMSLGLVEKKGPTKYIFRGKEFTSQSAVNQLLCSNPGVMAWTKAQILDIMAGHKKPAKEGE